MRKYQWGLALVASLGMSAFAGDFITQVNIGQMREVAKGSSDVVGKPVIVAETGTGYIYLGTGFFDTKSAYLPHCGGNVEMKVSHGDVHIIFRNVENCSNFDILSNNYDNISYPNKKLQGENQNRHGSFTLPKFVLDWGVNGVWVVLKSNSGKTKDYIHLSFVAR